MLPSAFASPLLWVTTFLLVSSPTQPVVAEPRESLYHASLAYPMRFSDYVAARNTSRDVTDVASTLNENLWSAKCEHRSDTEGKGSPSADRNTASALRCVVRAIHAGLIETSRDSTKSNTRITIGADVNCALGQLRIGAFVSDDAGCTTTMRDSVSIHVDSVLVRVYHRFLQEADYFKNRHEDIGRLLRHLLDARDLDQPLRAIVRSGFVLSDVSTDGDTMFNAGMGSASTDWGAPLPTILWETKTYNRLSLSGSIGQHHVLAAWSHDGDSSARELIVRSVDGFYYDLFLNVHLFHPREQLIDAFVGVGQERVANTTLADSVPLKLADNRVGPWSLRREFGIRYRVYSAARVDIEYGRFLPTPVLEVAVGIRRQERFEPNGDLEFLAEHYPTPRDRLFLAIRPGSAGNPY